MGCGSSANVVPSQETANGHKPANGQNGVTNDHSDHDHDDLPTVVLPDTPIKPKPPIAFEIPLEEIDGNRRDSNTPPPHLQRLLQPPQAEISLPDIEEKLAEAEQRRLAILQQRAASAQKRAQRMMKSMHEMDRLDSEHEPTDTTKHGINTLKIPPEPGVCEDKNIT
ncbi:uncharacterized protein LOC113522248 [Galleria mellonella]|uniref:Uncharacterized protein LOC113522248 n=1 Tax=Galleria mellonella TaxID=7137 RepID=A0A6J3C203_GALME|nr:uncharacterized protein LOC113522248 [Galleria mellonella]XP_031766672.2 uncharacterized protein LOC113522248 [Galleria mellonella]XP_031766673.2 uncharacterized protein LOC113522248 [Galleria mellonella]XP_052755347.1 uncharacterized protein LOC113522248 [Galleria mellonella]XP_052755348.1 uncharacterized protein LOC113522248 [Galleria mellonella]